jgi:outer membrane protein TolC
MGVKAGVNTRADLARATQELVAVQRQQIENRRDYVTAWLKLQRALSALTELQMEILLAGLSQTKSY